MLATRFGVQLMLAQEPVDRVERRQLRILLAPPAAKHLHRHRQVRLSLFQDPLLLLGAQRAWPAAIGARLRRQRGKAAVLVVIPPIFNGAAGKEPLMAIGQAQRTKAHLFQGYRKRKTLAQEVLDFGYERKTLQGQRLRRRSVRFVFHDPWFIAPTGAGK